MGSRYPAQVVRVIVEMQLFRHQSGSGGVQSCAVGVYRPLTFFRYVRNDMDPRQERTSTADRKRLDETSERFIGSESGARLVFNIKQVEYIV
jgi:hypothetical protein